VAVGRVRELLDGIGSCALWALGSGFCAYPGLPSGAKICRSSGADSEESLTTRHHSGFHNGVRRAPVVCAKIQLGFTTPYSGNDARDAE